MSCAASKAYHIRLRYLYNYHCKSSRSESSIYNFTRTCTCKFRKSKNYRMFKQYAGLPSYAHVAGNSNEYIHVGLKKILKL